MRIRKFKDSDAVPASRMLIKSFAWFHKNNKKSWLWKTLQPSYIISNSKSHDVSVAVDPHGEVVGYLASNSTMYGVAYISMVGVDPRYQGRGIAQRLLNRALSEFRRRKIRKVWLLVTYTNLKALQFYGKNGFFTEGYLRDHTGRGLHEVLLSKFLS